MLRFISVISVICAFMLFGTPANADLCRVYGSGLGEMGVRECTHIPNGWVDCGTKLNGETVWCQPDSGKRSVHKHDKTTAILVATGVSMAVVAVAWYFFKKSPSRNNPGQVSLATF